MWNREPCNPPQPTVAAAENTCRSPADGLIGEKGKGRGSAWMRACIYAYSQRRGPKCWKVVQDHDQGSSRRSYLWSLDLDLDLSIPTHKDGSFRQAAESRIGLLQGAALPIFSPTRPRFGGIASDISSLGRDGKTGHEPCRAPPAALWRWETRRQHSVPPDASEKRVCLGDFALTAVRLEVRGPRMHTAHTEISCWSEQGSEATPQTRESWG